MSWKDLYLRLRALLFPNQADRDLQEELDSHLALQTSKNIARGDSPAEAARLARIEFGGVAQISEECREARGISFLTTTAQDIRYAFRSFRRTPLFVLTVVGTIALGLGLDTALFTIFNAYYFQTVPVRAAQQLYECTWLDRAGNGNSFSWSEYRAFLAENPAFADAAAFQHIAARLDGRDISGTLVTGGYFRMLGVGAALGRTLVPEDSSVPGAEPVIVLSYAAWQNRFAGDAQIVGKKIFLRGYPFEVVGVAPAGFTGLGARAASFWAPITMSARLGPDIFATDSPRIVSIVGRLNDQYSAGQAREGLTVWTRHFETNGSHQSAPMRGDLTSRATYKPWNPTNALLFAPILVAFSLVLLIGCANVANMLLARAVARQREIGIRLCLGAARSRLIRQLLTESLLLSLPAAVAGFLFSHATIRFCLWLLNATLPPGINAFAARIPAMSPDLRVFAFALTFAILAALLFGLVPALQATRSNIVQVARGDFAAGLRPLRLRNSLVISQITLCVILLITAGILLRGIDRIHGLDRNLSSKETIRIAVQEKFRTRVLDRLSADSGLEIVAAAQQAPVDRKPFLSVTPTGGGAILRTATNAVSPEYFPLFEIPIIQGRGFSGEESDARLPVVVISRTAAQRLWPRQVAVGQTLQVLPEGSKQYPPARVIGIAEDEINRWLTNGEDKALVYFPVGARTAGSEFFVRVRGNAEAAKRKLDASLAAIDPLAVDDLERIQIREWVAEEAYSFKIAYWLSSAIGLLALLLTLSGIYGVIAFAVSQRTQEIGIRMALGATAQSVTGLFLKQSARLGLVGILLGCMAALGISRMLASVLVASNTFDGFVYIAVVLLVLGACAAAAFVPSRRVARIDPIVALRYD